MFLTEWIAGDAYSNALNLFDSNGQPFWLIDFDASCLQQPSGQQTHSCGAPFNDYSGYEYLGSSANQHGGFHVPYPGFDPFWDGTDYHFDDAHLFHTASGGFGRKYAGTSPGQSEKDHLTGLYCSNVSITLGNRVVNHTAGGTCGSSTSGSATAALTKVASLHHFEYSVVGNDDCDLSQGSCELNLTWFTDDYFPDARPAVIHWESGQQWVVEPLQDYCLNTLDDVSGQFAVYNQTCLWTAPVSAADNYRFALIGGADFGALQDAPIFAMSEKIVAAVDPTAPPVNPEPGASSPAVLADYIDVVPVPDHKPVGVIPGTLDVTQSGAASYTIPIKVSSARGDFAPQLSLSFNSQSGYGHAGEQWSIGGLSTITRCGQTLAQDENSTSVELNNASDRFCLDGQRLILKTGGAYGDDGTEYRLERNDHSRVYFFNPATQSSHFVVQRKDGTTEYYGAIPDPGFG
ncbi:MAG: SpvB/TcaC N-terminal domain-containing protein, partial [Pseudomonadota bacterium]